MANLSDQLGHSSGLYTSADWWYPCVEAMAIAEDIRL